MRVCASNRRCSNGAVSALRGKLHCSRHAYRDGERHTMPQPTRPTRDTGIKGRCHGPTPPLRLPPPSNR